MLKLEVKDGHAWHLCPSHIRAYGLSSLMMGASNDIFSCQLDYSIVDMFLVQEDIRNSPKREHILVNRTFVPIVHVKQEVPIVDISSESQGKSLSQLSMQPTLLPRSPNDVFKKTSS